MRRAACIGALTLLILCLALGAFDAHAQAKRHQRLFEQAQTHFAEQRWADGLPLLEQAVAAARREEGEGTFALYDLQFKLAEVTNLSGRMGEAIARMQEALATLRAWPGRTDLQEAGHLYRLAQYHHAHGDHRLRVERLAEAVALVDRPDTQAHLPDYLVALADAKDDLGEMAETLPLLERALAVYEQTGPPARVVETINRIAIAREWIGHYDRALEDYRRAVQVAEASFGPDHLQVANALNNLAQAVAVVGHHLEAAPLYGRARAIAEAHGTDGDYTRLAILQNLAALWYLRGDPEQAIAFARQSRDLADKTVGTSHPSYASAVAGLAGKLDAGPEALKLYREALALRRRLFGAEHPSVAATHASIAEVLLELGRYDEAVAENARVHAIAQKRLEPRHVMVVSALTRDAIATYRRGHDPKKAGDLLTRARRMGSELVGERSLRIATIDRHLAHTAAIAGRADRAVSFMRRAAVIEDAIIGELLGAGTDPQRRTLARRLEETTSEALDLYFTHLPGDPAARRLAAEMMLRRKGLALEVMTDRLARLRGGGAEQLEALAAARSRLAAMVLGGEGDRERVQEGRETLRRLEASLEEGENLHPEPVELEAVLGALGPDEALVEIQAYQPSDARRVPTGARRYGALVLRRSGIVGGRDLGRVVDIDGLAEDFSEAAGDPERDPTAAARRLHAAVVEPLLAWIGDAERLRISPDGALFLVPFAGTVDAAGRRLLERFHTSYLTTGRELVERRPSTASRVAVLVGAPRYGPERAAPRLGMSFPPLPGTAEEVRSLAGRLEPRLSEVRVLLGAEATEQRIAALRRPAVLHVATHGFFLRGAGGKASRDGGTAPLAQRSARVARPDGGTPPPNGGMPSAPERGARVARPAVQARELEAQLRSALVFAGANDPPSGAGSDGVLTAFEAATLDLEGTRLVVMSGCETGVGDVEGAEGVLGLRRAFALAGVETLVMSLWRVSDASTTQLMDRYYQALLAGAGRADALRQAQLAIAKQPETRHPYHWAGFIVSGQPGPIFEPTGELPEVAPSARGCACALTPTSRQSGAMPLALLLVTLVGRRRARTARRGDRRPAPRTPRTP